MWTLLRAPPAPRTPWAVRRHPSLPGPERISWLAPTPSCPLSSSPQWTSPQLRLSPRMSTSSSSVSEHPSLVQVLLGTHRCPLGRPAASGPHGACCVLPSTWQSDRADHGAGLTCGTFLPHRGDPQAPQARLRPSPHPLATTPPCSLLASRCPSVHPFGSWPWDALLMPRCTQLSSGSSQGSPRGGTSGCQLSARCPGVLVLLWLCTRRVLTVESLGQHDTFCADGGRARPPQRSPCAPPPRGRRTSPCCGRDVCGARCVAY